MNREIRAFTRLRKFISGGKCLLITNSEEDTINDDGLTVNMIPAWKWLLADHKSVPAG